MQCFKIIFMLFIMEFILSAAGLNCTCGGMIELTLKYTGSCDAYIVVFYDKENPSETLCSFNNVSPGEKIKCHHVGNVFKSDIYWEINCEIIQPRLLLSSSSSSSSSS
eukprot:429295_1